MAAPAELRSIADEVRAVRSHIEHLYLNPYREWINIMTAIDKLKALEPRLDAIAAAIGTDTATAVANATAPLNAQITDLQAQVAQTETDVSAEADTLAAKVSTLEPLVGISPPEVAPEPAQ